MLLGRKVTTPASPLLWECVVVCAADVDFGPYVMQGAVLCSIKRALVLHIALTRSCIFCPFCILNNCAARGGIIYRNHRNQCQPTYMSLVFTAVA